MGPSPLRAARSSREARVRDGSRAPAGVWASPRPGRSPVLPSHRDDEHDDQDHDPSDRDDQLTGNGHDDAGLCLWTLNLHGYLLPCQ